MQFISQDDLTFNINNKALKYCTKVSNTNLEVIKFAGINSNILRKVIQYCEIHQDDVSIPQISRPFKSNLIYDIVNFKDANFITSIDFQEISQIIQAAELLGIDTLVDLSCVYIALKIRGKSSEKIKLLFKANKPQTDEEDQRQRDIDDSAKGQRIQIFD
ncbi:unnamed protein product [Paramecium pentaurelia]|uniref:SKP1 component dimerisation domain-containing protein n=1 Tax=Paramecium pentaurelia TaxID=43138 RepID=A0A8S1SGP3_9CILI|nr:unnamed protein product [Paramecium pentaurelia]